MSTPAGQVCVHGALTSASHWQATHFFSRMCSSYSWRKYLSVESTGLGAVWPRPQRLVRLMARASFSRRSRSSISPSPQVILVRISSMRLVPIRHGHALAARLGLGEVDEEARQVDHAGGLVHDDHAAGAHDGAGLHERVVVDRQVEVLAAQTAAGRAAHLHRLEVPVARDAAAHAEDELAQGDAHRHLDEPGVGHLAGQREDLGALAALGAHGGEPLGAVAG